MTTVVPELLAKKRKRDEQAAAERAAAALESRKKARATRKEVFKRAEKYVSEYRSQVQLWVARSLFAGEHGQLMQTESAQRTFFCKLISIDY